MEIRIINDNIQEKRRLHIDQYCNEVGTKSRDP